MHYEQNIVGGWNVFTVHGDMSFPQIEKVDKMAAKIKNLVAEGEFKFIFDFSDVGYIDSSGISVVILTISNAMENDTPVKICGLNEMTKNTFEVMIDFGVEYFPTTEKALAFN